MKGNPGLWLEQSAGSFRSTFGVLADPTFRWYWLATLGYYSALRMEELARGFLAYDMTGSALMLGLVLVGQGLPSAIMGALGGTLADRIPKGPLLLWMQALLAATAVTMWLLVAAELVEYWHMVVLAIVHGIAVGLSLPARLSYVAEVAHPDQFVRAYGLYYVALNTMRIGGPALGGLLVVWLGMGGAYLAISTTHILALLTLLQVRPKVAPPTPSGKSFLHDLGEAFTYARRTPTLLILMSAELGKGLFATPSQRLLPVFAVAVYAVGAGGLGTLQAALGAGALVGSVVAAMAGGVRRKARLLLVVGTLEGALLILFASAPWFGIAALFLAAVGISSAVYTTFESTLFLLTAIPEMRGRAMGLRMFAHAITPLGIMPLGMLADAIGVRYAVALAGGLLVIFMIIVGVLFPSFRRLQSGLAVGTALGGAHGGQR